MKITFVLPFVNLTGGIKILFEHANRLARRGHTITIVYPGVAFHSDSFGLTNMSWQWRLIEAPLRQLKYWFFVTLLHKSDAAWFPLDPKIRLIRTPDLSDQYIPAADIVIGTAPETINFVASYSQSKGTKVHFAQDYEIWALPESFVDSTFSHPEMHLITIGSWQKKLYEEKFGRTVEAIIPNGVNLEQFNDNGKDYSLKSHETIRVLMNYHHAAYKAMNDGFAAIEVARQLGASIQIVMFGVHPLKDDVRSDVEYHQNISENDLPNLYRKSDIFLWPTHREGFGLPPMEALACGTPVVGTDSGAMRDYLQDGKTGFIVPIKEPKQLGQRLYELATHPQLRATMGSAAAQSMKAWDWELQSGKLEQYLQKLAKMKKS
jgi:glycosyltransferase involved in cell wall biosynthesis